jgi:hypothetical protein
VPRLRKRAAAVELAVLAASWLLLVWLAAGHRPPEPLTGWWLGPFPSFVGVVAVAWLAPGFVLARIAPGPWRRSPVVMAAFAFGLGLAWLAAPAAVVLAAGGDIVWLTWCIAGLNGALVLSYAGFLRGRPTGPEEPLPSPARPASPWLAAAAALALARLLAVALRRPRFTAGSDEWILMRTIRYFLEAKPIVATWDFDVWGLVTALLVRLAQVDLVDAYRVYLPAVLIVAASAAFLALAETLSGDRTTACFSYVVLALYALSDMHARGEGTGMALLVRVMEDKYAACLAVVPLAQAAMMMLLRSGAPSVAAVAGTLSLAAVLVSPLSVVWLAVTVGATGVAGVLTGRLHARRATVAPLALILAVAGLVAWWLRGQRHPSFFRLVAPEWPYSAVLHGLSHQQLWILSLESGWYVAHPALLRHPLAIAALLATAGLLPRFRRSLEAQFLVCSMLVPVLLVYNPVTARALGAWITPWMVYRVVWILPVALVLGSVLHGLLASWQRRLGPRAAAASPAAGRYAVLWLLVIGALAALLNDRTLGSRRALRLRNHVVVSQREKDLMHAVGRDPRLAGQVLAPREISIRLPAWTSRLRPSPGLDEIRLAGRSGLQDWETFYASSSIGEREVSLLRARRIDYVITRVGSPIDEAVRARPGPFKSVYDGPSYALYAWRPELWTAGSVTSFDTSARNLPPALP